MIDGALVQRKITLRWEANTANHQHAQTADHTETGF
jgi:hypothetical protein